GAVLLGGALMFSSNHPRIAARVDWLLLAAAAGILLGVANVALKALAESVPGSPASIASPLTLVAILGGIGTFLAFARSLQLGDPVAVVVVSTATTTLAAVIGGVLVYADPIGSDPGAVIARSTAFIAVIAAAALLPMVPVEQRVEAAPQRA
ncbi:MAG TPA: hypothetical protein VFL56_03135, partial [Solirubrobacterales bacterium]|nr:hypothetical protein [Solirubrobacterales bacterium]